MSRKPLVPSAGTCFICDGVFSRPGMTRHLQHCRRRYFAQYAQSKPTGTSEYFQLEVQSADRPRYWLHIEAPVILRLVDLDDCLREIWLECCDHHSRFAIGRTVYACDAELDQWRGRRGLRPSSMDVPLGEVLTPGLTFSYTYDDDSPTHLTLRVVDRYTRPAIGPDGFALLARNNPPEIPCVQCGMRLAQVICAACPTGEWLCSSCAGTHPCGDGRLLPVVNSPRVGMCRYTGEWVADPSGHQSGDQCRWLGDPAQILSNPAALDLGTRYFQQLVGDRRFPSLDEALRYVKDQLKRKVPLPPASEPRWIAHEILVDAYHASDPHEAVRLARSALDVFPNAADAYIIMAEHAPTDEEALKLLREGVKRGKKAVEPEAFTKHKGRLGDVLEALPYLRARAKLAEHLWALGRWQEAARHAEELLRLDGEDLQGVRPILLHALLATGDHSRAESLVNAFPQDTSTVWVYSKALLLFARHGDGPNARRALRDAFGVNPLVPLLVALGALDALDETAAAIAEDVEEAEFEVQSLLDEASSYLHFMQDGWEQVAGAIDWLYKLSIKHVYKSGR